MSSLLTFGAGVPPSGVVRRRCCFEPLGPRGQENEFMADCQSRLERRIRRDFPEPGSAGSVLEQLGELPRRAGYDDEMLASERVQAAIVLVAAGDIGRLRRAIDLAAADWRDVLVAAGLADQDWPVKLERQLGPYTATTCVGGRRGV